MLRARPQTDDLADLVDEPRVVPARIGDLLDRTATPRGLPHGENGRGWGGQCVVEIALIQLGQRRFAGVGVEPGSSRLQTPQRLLQSLGERPPDRHRLAHRPHRRAEHRWRRRELGEVEPGHLHHHVVERRLEGGRSGAGDVVGDLVECAAHGEQGGDLGDGEPRGLRGERTSATPSGSPRSRASGRSPDPRRTGRSTRPFPPRWRVDR